MPAVIQPIGLPLWIPAAYLALISLVSVCATVWDKCAARRLRRRIPEANLLLLGLLGGSLCMFITMKAIRLYSRFHLSHPLHPPNIHKQKKAGSSGSILSLLYKGLLSQKLPFEFYSCF